MLFLFIGMTLLAALSPGLAVLLVTSNALRKALAPPGERLTKIVDA
jgi:threonine/homoserine/homoserine lactone efflux protein